MKNTKFFETKKFIVHIKSDQVTVIFAWSQVHLIIIYANDDFLQIDHDIEVFHAIFWRVAACAEVIVVKLHTVVVGIIVTLKYDHTKRISKVKPAFKPHIEDEKAKKSQHCLCFTWSCSYVNTIWGKKCSLQLPQNGFDLSDRFKSNCTVKKIIITVLVHQFT